MVVVCKNAVYFLPNTARFPLFFAMTVDVSCIYCTVLGGLGSLQSEGVFFRLKLIVSGKLDFNFIGRKPPVLFLVA